MNWETTKTWLIVSFLVLDLFLGWQLIQYRQEMRSYTEPYPDLLANTKTLLADHGFVLDTSVPSSEPTLPTLKAAFAKPALKQLARTALPSNGSTVHINTKQGTAQSPDGRIKRVSDGTWQVTYKKPQVLTGHTPGRISGQVLKWVPDGNLYRLDSTLQAQGTLLFEQQYGHFPIFDATVSASVNNSRLYGFLETELTGITAANKPKPVITALDALASLAESMDKSTIGSDNKIDSISLGYAHKLSANSNVNASSSGYWFPVWRIVTGSTIYYINAFSGEVETASS